MVYEGIHCRLAVERPADGVVLVRLNGWDVGEFGAAPMKEIARDFSSAPIQLFIDARQVKGATIDVSNDWAQWLRANRASFAHVSMLAGSPFVKLTARFVQRFAGLDEVMRIYTDAAAFDREVTSASARAASRQPLPASSGR